MPIFRNQEWFNDAKLKLGDFWEEVLYYREMGLDFLKEELNSQKEEKRRIKEEKREQKKKEADSKKQKKIKDFINLNDDSDENKSQDNKTSAHKEDKSEDSSETDSIENTKNIFDDVMS